MTFSTKNLFFDGLLKVNDQKSRIRSQIRKSVVRIRYIIFAYYYYKAGWPVSFWRRSWTSFSPPRPAPARSCSRPPRRLAPATAAAWAKPNTGFWPRHVHTRAARLHSILNTPPPSRYVCLPPPFLSRIGFLLCRCVKNYTILIQSTKSKFPAYLKW